MRARTLLATAITTASAAAPLALGLEAQPLTQPTGVVVGFEAQPGIAAVALADGKLLAVHTSRNAIWRPGTRVRLEGISWGAPTEGIKWATAPAGVRVAIERAANGTYSSALKRLGRVTRSTIRGTVVARVGSRTLAVTVPGATVLVPLSAASGKVTHSLTLPAVGSTVAIPVAFDARGRLSARRARVLHRPVPGAAVPLSGRVSAIDAATRTLRLRAGGARVVSFRVAVPAAFDLTAYRVGQDLAVTAVPAPDGSLAATSTALNGSFAQADDPAGVQALAAPAPAPETPAPGVDPADLQTAELMRVNWSRAVESGLVPDPSVAQAGAARIATIRDRIFHGQRADAVGQLSAFIGELAALPAGAIPPDVRDRESQLATALRTHLGG